MGRERKRCLGFRDGLSKELEMVTTQVCFLYLKKKSSLWDRLQVQKYGKKEETNKTKSLTLQL